MPPGVEVPVQIVAQIAALAAGGAIGGSTDGGNRQTLLNNLNVGGAGFPGMGNAGGNTLHRLKEGIERFMITDINNPAAGAMAQSELPVMFDLANLVPSGNAKFNHVPGGVNSLYMDGHVAFSRYPDEKFPGNVGWAAISQCVAP